MEGNNSSQLLGAMNNNGMNEYVNSYIRPPVLNVNPQQQQQQQQQLQQQQLNQQQQQMLPPNQNPRFAHPTQPTVQIDESFWARMDNMLDTKLKVIEDKFDKAVTGLNAQVNMLSSRCDKFEEDVSTLKSIVVKQQHYINKIDSDKRDCNIIVTGVPETDITINDTPCNNDKSKVTAILDRINCRFEDDFKIERWGKENIERKYPRTILLTVGNKTTRDNILKKSKELKDAGEIFSTIYLKKDLHPVLVQENKRLLKKKKDLLALDINKEKEIKLEKGVVTVDGVEVDRNLFFV